MSSLPQLDRAVRRSSLAVVGLLLVSTAVAEVAPVAHAASSCGAFTSKVYDQVNPTTTAQSLSGTAAGYAAYQSIGFSETRPNALSAAPRSGPSLKPVHRLYRASNRNYFYSLDDAEIARAIKTYRYRDLGVVFYASTEPASCLNPVWSYFHPRGYHRFVSSASEGQNLVAAGWRKEAVRFHLGKSSSASVFTFAVMPDTQQEFWIQNQRMADRVRWLTGNQNALDLRFVTHSGDVVDWDTGDHVQYQRARDGLAGLRGKIPYSLTVGNHDTAAVGIGGSAADPPNTWRLIRDTATFNRYLDQGTEAMSGQFEYGKVDNAYHTFSAAERQWLVLNLEMLPRRSVVDWAKQIVARHPHHNVMVVTHMYLTGSGNIGTRVEYGETSPQYLFDNLIKKYPNIKLVFSGHTGSLAHRQDAGAGGSLVNSFLQTMHSRTTNPVRIVEVNVSTGTVASFVYAPDTKQVFTTYEVKARAAGWVR